MPAVEESFIRSLVAGREGNAVQDQAQVKPYPFVGPILGDADVAGAALLTI